MGSYSDRVPTSWAMLALLAVLWSWNNVGGFLSTWSAMATIIYCERCGLGAPVIQSLRLNTGSRDNSDVNG